MTNLSVQKIVHERADKLLKPSQRAELKTIIELIAQDTPDADICRTVGISLTTLKNRLKSVKLTKEDIRRLPDIRDSRTARYELAAERLSNRVLEGADSLDAKEAATALRAIESLITPQQQGTIAVTFDISRIRIANNTDQAIDITPEEE
jgi:hypothetical protein